MRNGKPKIWLTKRGNSPCWVIRGVDPETGHVLQKSTGTAKKEAERGLGEFWSMPPRRPARRRSPAMGLPEVSALREQLARAEAEACLTAWEHHGRELLRCLRRPQGGSGRSRLGGPVAIASTHGSALQASGSDRWTKERVVAFRGRWGRRIPAGSPRHDEDATEVCVRPACDQSLGHWRARLRRRRIASDADHFSCIGTDQ